MSQNFKLESLLASHKDPSSFNPQNTPLATPLQYAHQKTLLKSAYQLYPLILHKYHLATARFKLGTQAQLVSFYYFYSLLSLCISFSCFCVITLIFIVQLDGLMSSLLYILYILIYHSQELQSQKMLKRFSIKLIFKKKNLFFKSTC